MSNMISNTKNARKMRELLCLQVRETEIAGDKNMGVFMEEPEMY